MLTLGEKIKEARKKSNLKQSDIADALNIKNTTVSNWEKDISKPDIDTIEYLCRAFNVSASYFIEDLASKEILSVSEKEVIKKYRALDEHGKDVTDYVLNAEYARCIKEPEVTYETVLKPDFQACLSAGTGQFVFDDLPCEQIEVPIEYSDIDFVIGVSGDSMEPTYHDGDKVMIKKGEVAIGQVGAFMINGVALLKELGEDKLISHNKEYNDILFDEFMRIDCVGKVVGKL